MGRSARAAVLRSPNGPFTIENIAVEAPRTDEVLVRVHACGVCHTDMAVRSGLLPPAPPAVLGHEGAGVVEQIGAGVSHVAPGDAVIISTNSCGTCPNCAIHKPTYCYNSFPFNFSGSRPDGTTPVTGEGGDIRANFFGQSSFSTLALATKRNVVKVPGHARGLPFATLAPLGCGFMTGAGAILNSLRVRPGSSVLVLGTGAVGLAAIMAAKLAEASPIIAVDVHDQRLELARTFGASITINSKSEDAGERIKAVAGAGVSFAFDTTGLKSVIELAFAHLAPMGSLGIVGASSMEETLTFNEFSFMASGKTVKGILGGDADPQIFLPQLIDYHLAGKFPHDRLIRTYALGEINRAFHESETGEVVKPVLVMDGD